MRIAILIHEGCHIPHQLMERAILKALKQENPKALLLMGDKLSRGLQGFVKQRQVALTSVEDLRKEGTWGTRFWERLFPINDRDLLLKRCDKVLLFWDETPAAKKLLSEIRDAGKDPLIVKMPSA